MYVYYACRYSFNDIYTCIFYRLLLKGNVFKLILLLRVVGKRRRRVLTERIYFVSLIIVVALNCSTLLH